MGRYTQRQNLSWAKWQDFLICLRVCSSRSNMGRKSSRNDVALLLLLFALVFLHLSCARRRPVTIRLAGDEWFLTSLTRTGMIANFEARSGIHVEVVHQNDRSIISELDRGPNPGDTLDLIAVRHRLLGALVQKNQVQPIDSYLADSTLHDPAFIPAQQLFPNWWRELSTYDGKTYGFPFTGLTTFLCYRKDLLNDAANQRNFKVRYHRDLKPPTNWQEYSQLAEFFTRPNEHFYGTYIQGKQGLALWYEWLNFVYSFGGNILDTQHGWEYGDIVVNSPQNIAATEQYTKLIAFSPPDTLKYGWGEAQSALQHGTRVHGPLVERSGALPGRSSGFEGGRQDRLQSRPFSLRRIVQPVGRFDLPDPDGVEASARSLQVS